MTDDALASARIRLQQLQALHAAGRLDDAAYDTERRAVEHELGQTLLAQAAGPVAAAPATPAAAAVSSATSTSTSTTSTTSTASAPATVRPSKGLVAVLTLAVLAIALGGYVKTGSPSLIANSGKVADPVAAQPVDPAASGPTGLQQIAAMVEQLAARMKERPNDPEGWVMLARSYTVLGRFADALPAYQRAAELLPKNAGVLADWADAVAATKGTANNPETLALIARALAIDPDHPKTLALAGTADYERGDYAGAIARWQAIAARLPPESELAKQIGASIDDARAKLAAAGGSAPARAALPPMAKASAPAQAAGSSPTAVASGVIEGTASLDPKLAARVDPDDTVFVFARAANGGRMPLAVQRARARDLPLRFRLDDTMAMAPGMTLSSAGPVTVGARISRTGNAMPTPGDLAGEAFAPALPGARNVVVKIDRVVGTP